MGFCYRNSNGDLMSSIRRLLLGALLVSAPVLSLASEASGGSSGASTTDIGSILTGVVLKVSQAIRLGVVLHVQAVPLGSTACGALAVTNTSSCQIVADSACLSSCGPDSFAKAAFDQCAASCDKQAPQGCKQACVPSCKSTCLAECDFNPVSACEAVCKGGCAATCAAKMAVDGVDASDCNAACAATCTNECAEASAAIGIDNCGIECGASCDAGCAAVANMECQIGCQVALFESMSQVCEGGCLESGALFCDGQPVPLLDLDDCVAALKAAGIPVNGG